jgi:hypothetical protein
MSVEKSQKYSRYFGRFVGFQLEDGVSRQELQSLCQSGQAAGGSLAASPTARSGPRHTAGLYYLLTTKGLKINNCTKRCVPAEFSISVII